ncbi:anhydro-N-acetylmuramic acid kinase [Bacteroidia bacterium]|nr:anhydro-N-acetylmuramic acid kinase [Bacteroidia bacterium]GHT81425.1 anhydro-N-acetylmuramic acid kinase [Bacteroidia bacterium]
MMSGTSLDGLDLCLSSFYKEGKRWHFDIEVCQTVAYSDEWREKLQIAHTLPTLDFVALHKSYGKFLGEQARAFLQQNNAQADYIASHGHTIFHQPQRGITFQLGDGNTLAAAAHCSTIFDFRSLSVALGGQGAPLVPVGDALLFADYDACLNLGGFANISYNNATDNRIAFDVCPCNIVLNYLCQTMAQPYDPNGQFAAQGTVDNELLVALNQLDFYTQTGAKSLGREWVETVIFDIINCCKLSIYDKLCTFCEHIAMQVAAGSAGKNIMVTGGGAHNDYLMQRIAHHCKGSVHKPSRTIIDFKEALIFAFLGVLYLHNQPNCLVSATGGKDCIGGVLVKI